MKKQKIYLDMDGTIANLYAVPNWLPKLQNEIEGTFIDVEPMISEDKLLKMFPLEQYEIIIQSMTPAKASKEYQELVKKEKDAWLNKFFPNLKKRIYMKYGHNKNLKACANAILIDDNELIRKNYKGFALNPAGLLW